MEIYKELKNIKNLKSHLNLVNLNIVKVNYNLIM